MNFFPFFFFFKALNTTLSSKENVCVHSQHTSASFDILNIIILIVLIVNNNTAAIAATATQIAAAAPARLVAEPTAAAHIERRDE